MTHTCQHRPTGQPADDCQSCLSYADHVREQQRLEVYNTLHRHAYNWASDHVDPALQDPETFADDYARVHTPIPAEEWPSYPTFYETWAVCGCTLNPLGHRRHECPGMAAYR